ncbi:hypothetical protein KR018_001392 [Drosophila ironensis]|nr:hypothetical protein KR018_001392 [Drosophila ironensis]
MFQCTRCKTKRSQLSLPNPEVRSVGKDSVEGASCWCAVCRKRRFFIKCTEEPNPPNSLEDDSSDSVLEPEAQAILVPNTARQNEYDAHSTPIPRNNWAVDAIDPPMSGLSFARFPSFKPVRLQVREENRDEPRPPWSPLNKNVLKMKKIVASISNKERAPKSSEPLKTKNSVDNQLGQKGSGTKKSRHKQEVGEFDGPETSTQAKKRQTSGQDSVTAKPFSSDRELYKKLKKKRRMMTKLQVMRSKIEEQYEITRRELKKLENRKRKHQNPKQDTQQDQNSTDKCDRERGGAHFPLNAEIAKIRVSKKYKKAKEKREVLDTIMEAYMELAHRKDKSKKKAEKDNDEKHKHQVIDLLEKLKESKNRKVKKLLQANEAIEKLEKSQKKRGPILSTAPADKVESDAYTDLEEYPTTEEEPSTRYISLPEKLKNPFLKPDQADFCNGSDQWPQADIKCSKEMKITNMECILASFVQRASVDATVRDPLEAIKKMRVMAKLKKKLRRPNLEPSHPQFHTVPCCENELAYARNSIAHEMKGATELDVSRSPLYCPDYDCRRLTFVSDLNNHLQFDHRTLAMERISVRQVKTFFLDARLVGLNRPKCRMLYLVREKLMDTHGDDVKDLLPVLVMTTRANMLQVTGLSEASAICAKGKENEVLLIWLSSLVPSGKQLTGSISVWSSRGTKMRPCLSVNTSCMYDIRAPHDVATVCRSPASLMIPMRLIRKMTNRGSTLLVVQVQVY